MEIRQPEQSMMRTRRQRTDRNERPGVWVEVMGEREKQMNVLLRSIVRFLDRGNVSKASSAYGVVLRLLPDSKEFDIRKHNLWAIGAEILLRSGEKPGKTQLPQGSILAPSVAAEKAASWSRNQRSAEGEYLSAPARWASSANAGQVKVYIETLAQQYPYQEKNRKSAPAPDWELAMLGCEFYNVHRQCCLALAQLLPETSLEENECRTDDDVMKLDHGPGHLEATTGQEGLRTHFLATLRNMTGRMDLMLQTPPHNKNNDLIRLRAMASLCIADLLAPLTKMCKTSRIEAQQKRQLEQQTAIRLIRQLVSKGGEADKLAQTLLVTCAEDQVQSDSPKPSYSWLPV